MCTVIQLRDGGLLAETPDYLAEIRLGTHRVEILQESHTEYSLATSTRSAQNAAERVFKLDYSTRSLSVYTTACFTNPFIYPNGTEILSFRRRLFK
jgi:hypothetical protein